MHWFLLLGCTNHRVEALEARVAELEATQAAQQEQIAALQAQLAWLGKVDSASALLAGPRAEMVTIPGFEGQDSAALVRSVISREDAETLRDPDALGHTLRAVPHTSDAGAPEGLRLAAIRADSLGARIGLKNGDLARAWRSGDASWSPTDTLDDFVAFCTELAQGDVELLVTRRGALTVVRFTPA